MKTKTAPKPVVPAKPEVITLDSVVDQFMYELDNKIKLFAGVKEKFLKDAEANPADAVQWGYDKLALYQFEAANAMLLKTNTIRPVVELLPSFADGNMVGYPEAVALAKTNIQGAIEHFMDRVVCGAKWPTHSTSAMANFNAQQKLSADTLTLELLKSTLKRLERITGC